MNSGSKYGTYFAKLVGRIALGVDRHENHLRQRRRLGRTQTLFQRGQRRQGRRAKIRDNSYSRKTSSTMAAQIGGAKSLPWWSIRLKSGSSRLGREIGTGDSSTVGAVRAR